MSMQRIIGFGTGHRSIEQSHIFGSILGTAIGDAIGLPYEGLLRERANRLLGLPDRHRFVFGHGMVSDDTELTCMVAQAIIATCGDIDTFERQLSWRFRLWLLGFPAGIGFTTLLSIIRLWIGFSVEKSGMFSAGNGPAVRASIIGATIDNLELLQRLVRASSRITHTDPKAEYGALAVALASRMARRNDTVAGSDFLDQLKASLDKGGNELVSLIHDVVNSVESGQSTRAFADSMGLSNSVSGYVYHSVPIAIHAWLSNQGNFRSAVIHVVECGGDTDSTGAIVGGIVGASVGRAGIPSDWIERMCEWPRSIKWMERLTVQLESVIQSNSPVRPIKLPIHWVLTRNLLFLAVVLCHGIRRLLPPY